MVHRGPDDSGIHQHRENDIALGHRRLAIIDLSPSGRQPMSSEDGAVTIVFNGEIYNFRELREELEAKGSTFKGKSDTEVLINLYLSEGMAMLPRLNGMFAFGLYDARTNDLYVCRDASGIKPIYYLESERGFAFASEIKGLLPLLEGRPKIDGSSLHRYATFLWCPGNGTALQAVRKLSPGFAMQVKGGRVARLWNWRPTKPFSESSMRAADAVALVEKGLRSAVQRQMVADVPVGAFLSGGLDSSAVVAFAREQAPNIQCFTIEPFGGEDSGEVADLPYARQVAAHLGVKLEVVPADAEGLASHLERVVWHLDEPLADPAALNVLYIAQAARDMGVKVLLSGAGGDDLFTGYRRHLAVRYETFWSWMPTSMIQQCDHWISALHLRSVRGRRLTRLAANVADRAEMGLAAYFCWARRKDLMALYSPALHAEIGYSRAEEPMTAYLAGLPTGLTKMEKLLELEQRFFLADHNLNYTDKMSMAASVEVRPPFLDPQLIEISAIIPDKFKQNGNIGKWVLKRAMEPYLPSDVVYRPKVGFGVPLRHWIKTSLRDMIDNILSAENITSRGLFDSLAVRRIIEDNDAGRRDWAYTIFSLLCIELWCRQFIDRARPTTHKIGA